MANETVERYRLIVLGSGQVGKTCVIRRYLHNQFPDKYKETVEDIFCRDFHIHGALLPLDVYDTNYSYPDMRRLSMASANAFLLIFAVDNVNSFKAVTELMQEVFDRRPEAVDMPLLLAGNKIDTGNKKIYPETVQAWLAHFTPRKNIKYLEVSAKTGENIREVFKTLLDMSGFPYRMKLTDPLSLLSPLATRRQLSQRARSPNRKRDAHLAPPGGVVDEEDDNHVTIKHRLSRTLSRKGDRDKDKEATVRETSSETKFTRHGSLMRKSNRMSVKIKQTDVDLPDESDCKIS